MADFIAKEKPGMVLSTLQKYFDPRYLMPIAYYLRRDHSLNIPVIEVPRFLVVGDRFVSPTVHYLLCRQLKGSPPQETHQKLRE